MQSLQINQCHLVSKHFRYQVITVLMCVCVCVCVHICVCVYVCRCIYRNSLINETFHSVVLEFFFSALFEELRFVEM